MKSIVSFDLDMTLLDHNTWKIPASALEAIDHLRKTHLIVIASGRDMDHAYSVEFRDMIMPDAVIHMNGTKITVGDKLIFEHSFDKMLLERLLHYSEDSGYSIGTSMEDGDYYTHIDTVIRQDKARWNTSARNFLDPWRLMDKQIRTLSYLGHEAGAKQIEQQFPELKLPMFAGKQGADVIEKGISKAEGLIRLCQYYGIDPSDTVSFGDSMNDYEIIKAAGLGIAMGNAIEELKAVADYTTERIEEDGIWKACKHFQLFH